MKCAIQMTKLSIILLHGLLIIIEMSIETLQGEKNSFAITIRRRRRCSRAWTVLYTWYKCTLLFRSFFESSTYKSSQRKIRRKIVQTRISKRWIHIKDTKHRWMVLLLFFSPSFTTFFLRSIFQTHTQTFIWVYAVHRYIHTPCTQIQNAFSCAAFYFVFGPHSVHHAREPKSGVWHFSVFFFSIVFSLAFFCFYHYCRVYSSFSLFSSPSLSPMWISTFSWMYWCRWNGNYTQLIWSWIALKGIVARNTYRKTKRRWWWRRRRRRCRREREKEWNEKKTRNSTNTFALRRELIWQSSLLLLLSLCSRRD